MKSVLMSIKPEWCVLIASGKKTFELRKSFPHLENLNVPFKVYIYQTKPKERLLEVMKEGDTLYGETYHGKPAFIKTTESIYPLHGTYGRWQKVIGEFVCDYANNVYPTGLIVGDDRLTVDGNDDMPIDKYCMTEEQVRAYIGEKKGVGWHISDLVIYDQPKKLTEFHAPCDSKCDGMCYEGVGCCRVITRPPQSWCYVDEMLLVGGRR